MGYAEKEEEVASGTDESSDPYGLGNKNEVMMLHELCAKKGIRLMAKVANKVDQDGQVSNSHHDHVM